MQFIHDFKKIYTFQIASILDALHVYAIHSGDLHLNTIINEYVTEITTHLIYFRPYPINYL